MKKLVLQKWIFLSAAILCAMGFAAALIFHPANWAIFAPLSLAAGSAAAVLFANLRKKLIETEVIVENAIIHIQPAVTAGQTDGDKKENEQLRENFGIYVSIFGILLGNKIIKWGDGSGGQLKSVEIGRDYISIGYGAKNKTLQNIRLLYFKPDGAALSDIIEKFRYKTGVVPVIV